MKSGESFLMELWSWLETKASFLYKLFAVVALSATSSGLHSPFQFTKIEILPPLLEKSITPENRVSCRDRRRTDD